MAQLLAQGLRLKEGVALLDQARKELLCEEGKEGEGEGSDNVAMCLSVARAAAVLGDWFACQRALGRARAALASEAAGEVEAASASAKGRAAGARGHGAQARPCLVWPGMGTRPETDLEPCSCDTGPRSTLLKPPPLNVSW